MDKIKNLYYIKYNSNILDKEVITFVEQWHYSKSCRSMLQKEVYTLHKINDNTLVGVAIFGLPVSRHQNDGSTLELRRFCLIDETPKNSESFFLGMCLRKLKLINKYTKIVSFADPNYGHEGIIYKATNFKYDGRSKEGNPTIYKYNNVNYHKREVYQKKNSQYTPTAQKIQLALKSGEAVKVRIQTKHRYIFELTKAS